MNPVILTLFLEENLFNITPEYTRRVSNVVSHLHVSTKGSCEYINPSTQLAYFIYLKKICVNLNNKPLLTVIWMPIFIN
jgi:hypothetical protein